MCVCIYVRAYNPRNRETALTKPDILVTYLALNAATVQYRVLFIAREYRVRDAKCVLREEYNDHMALTFSYM